MQDIRVPVSPGELLDKITILRIKSVRITDPDKRANVGVELAMLEDAWAASEASATDMSGEAHALQQVNERLWDVEDALRDKEAAGSFDEEFVQLARAVYTLNDERAAIKRRINARLDSRIVEEKSYAGASA